MIKIWSMKAKEAAAEKKKPKTSAAQIRVQKGILSFLFIYRPSLPPLSTEPCSTAILPHGLH
jgi:hypothetical protein